MNYLTQQTLSKDKKNKNKNKNHGKHRNKRC